MSEPFIGSDAVAAGDVTKSSLRRRYTRLFPDVYVVAGAEPTAQDLARGGWLWSGRKAVVAGRSAAALLGAKWIDGTLPVDLIHDNRNRPSGITVRGDRLEDDEIQLLDGMPVTTPLRTALDLACWYPRGTAMQTLDALARATSLDAVDALVLAERYPGRRGIRAARENLKLVDRGAQSPKETWLRLLLIDAGFPRPQTQIPVLNEFGDEIAYLDMGWEDIKVAVEYDGEQHRTDRWQYTRDLRRRDMLEELGWIVVRVVAGDRQVDIIRHVRAAIARRASLESHVRRSA
jgi:very-short-patch-repair endonuclease